MNSDSVSLLKKEHWAGALLRAACALVLGYLCCVVVGCGGSAPNNPPPTNLAYSQATITVVVGQAFSTGAPTVTGSVSSYAVTPALPAGLSLNSSTGVISGTPANVASQASYTVTATNSSGSTSATLQITVNPVAPTNLIYPQATITAIVGQPVGADTPAVTGTVTSYAVSPALPAGLSLSASTGAISGTPSSVTAQAGYTITATNASGSTTATVQITVNPAAPSNLVYPQATINAVVGQAISTDAPSVTSSVSSYAASPALPSGLILNVATGAISGTPTAASAKASYTVTATNASGSTSATLQITVNPVPPTNLAYPQTAITAIVGQPVSADTPTVTGTVASYAVIPALPAGLNLNATTGAITGTPTAVSPQATYTVTAANASGSTTAALQITVAPAAPSNLVYPQAAIAAIVGQAITADTPSITGTVASYAVSPALPAGLSLNVATGAISGTPTAVSAQTSYTITASNTSGSTPAMVQITVNPVAPTSLAYPLPAITAIVGQLITTDTPKVTGTVSSYTVSPALPAGLSLNASTGAISGTPTSVTAQASYTVTATNVSGSTTAAVQITVNPVAPTDLVYPQPTITAAVGQAISADAPTVTGTVSSYAVSPALPAGLSLNASTGTISGTPSAAVAQASYTVTATNASGSTIATVQITVTPPPPSNLIYPQTTITATVTESIPADTPTVTGTVSSYAVSPALPPGITLNASTGAISGTPTAVTAQASYTITATNAYGSTTATVQIAVSSFSSFSLVDLGHANSIYALRLQSTRVFSQDTSSHWALWDYASGAELASGDPAASGSSTPYPSDMAGSVLAVGTAGAVEIRSNANGSLISTLASPSLDPTNSAVKAWWKLATDGSYLASGYSSGLFVWSTTNGQLLFSRAGDYSNALAFAGPGQVEIALGPAGTNVIETDSVPAGTSSTGPAFTGAFNAWFGDGSHFISNSVNLSAPFTPPQYNVYIYSAAGTQQGSLTLGNISGLNGYSNWFWTSAASAGSIVLYPVGSSTPAATYSVGAGGLVSPFGSTIGLLPYGAASASIVDLSGSAPVLTQTTLPVAYGTAFAAISPAQWISGNVHGVVFDGASVSTTPRFFGYGNAFSMTGSSDSVAISTASGKILVYAPSSKSLTTAISFTSSKVAMSADGTILAAMASSLDSQYEPDRTLNIYSLPTGAITYSFPYTFSDSSPTPFLFDYTISGSGNALGQLLGAYNGTYFDYTREVTPLAGSPVVWSDNPASGPYPGSMALFLSPDGTLIAASDAGSGYSSASTTSIYKNGVPIATVNGFVVGWIDNNRVLVDTFSSQPGDTPVYNGSLIYDATGAQLASLPALPQLTLFVTNPALTGGFLTVDPNSIYAPSTFSIYSLTTGAVLWSETQPHAGTTTGPYSAASTVSGNYVIFTSGTKVLVDLP